MWTKTFILVLLWFSNLLSIAYSYNKVYWLPNKSIQLATNFQSEMLPCSGQTIVFPDSIEESVLISSLSISGLILPMDGEIILEEGGIFFGSDDNDNCTIVGKTYYKGNQISSWAQPDVWSSASFNEATPDAERVPCFNDLVLFPEKGQFAVKLPDRPQTISAVLSAEHERFIRLSDLINKQTNDQFQQFIETEPGMVTTTFSVSSRRACSSTLPGCPCQEYALDIECKLKYCPQPKCSYPIKPEGHCCELCGSSLLLEITQKFDMASFKESVEQMVESYGHDKLVYHIGLLPQKYGVAKQPERVQLVVLDKGEYTGTCQQVVSEINYKLSSDWVKSNALYFSGNPTSQAGMGGKIFISVFFIVVITLGALFGYYYKWSMSDLGELRGGVTRGMLSRLQRRTESVMSLARRDSTVSTATLPGTSFRNPMYSSMRDKVRVEAAVDEE